LHQQRIKASMQKRFELVCVVLQQGATRGFHFTKNEANDMEAWKNEKQPLERLGWSFLATCPRNMCCCTQHVHVLNATWARKICCCTQHVNTRNMCTCNMLANAAARITCTCNMLAHAARNICPCAHVWV
jgi:hypothetical protein